MPAKNNCFTTTKTILGLLISFAASDLECILTKNTAKFQHYFFPSYRKRNFYQLYLYSEKKPTQKSVLVKFLLFNFHILITQQTHNDFIRKCIIHKQGLSQNTFFFKADLFIGFNCSTIV